MQSHRGTMLCALCSWPCNKLLQSSCQHRRVAGHMHQAGQGICCSLEVLLVFALVPPNATARSSNAVNSVCGPRIMAPAKRSSKNQTVRDLKQLQMHTGWLQQLLTGHCDAQLHEPGAARKSGEVRGHTAAAGGCSSEAKLAATGSAKCTVCAAACVCTQHCRKCEHSLTTMAVSSW